MIELLVIQLFILLFLVMWLVIEEHFVNRYEWGLADEIANEEWRLGVGANYPPTLDDVAYYMSQAGLDAEWAKFMEDDDS
jgi:hypothetical protein